MQYKIPAKGFSDDGAPPQQGVEINKRKPIWGRPVGEREGLFSIGENFQRFPKNPWKFTSLEKIFRFVSPIIG